MIDNLNEIYITGIADPTTGVHNLVIHAPFIDLLIFIILIITALYGFNFIIRILWK